jgi:hypothetical protein
MSTFENIVLRQSPSHGLSDPVTVGLVRKLGEVLAYLRGELWIVRLTVCCGFASAVLLQIGLFSLIAQLVLKLDAALLPGLTASAYCLAIGSLGMLASRSLGASQSAVAAR